MAAPSHRRQQIGHLLRDAIIEVVGELEDERAQLATVTEVLVAADGRSARVFFMAPGTLEDRMLTEEALNGAAGHIRALLTEMLTLRVVPALHFVRDEQSEQATRLDALLHQIEAEEKRRGSR